MRIYQVRGTMLEEMSMNMRRKWLAPFGMWIVFEIVAVTLWLFIIEQNILIFQTVFCLLECHTVLCRLK